MLYERSTKTPLDFGSSTTFSLAITFCTGIGETGNEGGCEELLFIKNKSISISLLFREERLEFEYDRNLESIFSFSSLVWSQIENSFIRIFFISLLFTISLLMELIEFDWLFSSALRFRRRSSSSFRSISARISASMSSSSTTDSSSFSSLMSFKLPPLVDG